MTKFNATEAVQCMRARERTNGIERTLMRRRRVQQVEEGKRRQLHADHQAAHAAGELRSVAHQLASLQEQTAHLATRARKTDELQQLLEERATACAEREAEVAVLTSARDSSGMLLFWLRVPCSASGRRELCAAVST